MRRIGLAVILSLTLAPLAVESQQAANPSASGYSERLQRHRRSSRLSKQGLGQFGYTEGRDFIFDQRHGEGGLLSPHAAELARLNVDVIFARGAAAVAAAKAVTRTIPVVAVDLESDPVAAGFVRSL